MIVINFYFLIFIKLSYLNYLYRMSLIVFKKGWSLIPKMKSDREWELYSGLIQALW